MENWAIVVLTLALVVVTWLYQRDTHRMATEMRRARGAQVMPRIVLTVDNRGAGNAFWRILNAGPGPALELDVELRPEPDGIGRRLTMPVMVQDDVHDLMPLLDPSDERSSFITLDETGQRFTHLHLRGRCRDVFGDELTIDERFAIKDWWEDVKAAQVIMPHDWPQETVRVLEKIEGDLKAIGRNIERQQSWSTST